ncbi:MAG: hypothetical protein LQ344_003254 [Seirophora lacunosa]|nr:MAG: hypothetical protein LQ344_003254 [Seirophora lacunosa]
MNMLHCGMHCPYVKTIYWWALLLLYSIIPTTAAQKPQYILANDPRLNAIPTVHESAVQARRILNISSIATLSTVFPEQEHPAILENRPPDLGGVPIGLIDYYASCDPIAYEPTILAISIATSFKNARAGSNVTLSLRYHPPFDHPPGDDIYTYSPANLPRFSLVGHIEPVPASEARQNGIDRCFFKRHPDAVAWKPGNTIHESWWARLVVEQIYWIGGFGDRAYIGWIPVEEWRGVTREEVEATRLIGEHGYKTDENP